MFTRPVDVFIRRARILDDPPEGVSAVAISEFLTARSTPYILPRLVLGQALPEEVVISFHN